MLERRGVTGDGHMELVHCRIRIHEECERTRYVGSDIPILVFCDAMDGSHIMDDDAQDGRPRGVFPAQSLGGALHDRSDTGAGIDRIIVRIAEIPTSDREDAVDRIASWIVCICNHRGTSVPGKLLHDGDAPRPSAVVEQENITRTIRTLLHRNLRPIECVDETSVGNDCPLYAGRMVHVVIRRVIRL